ncbi:putative porin [Hymenobacter humi]|uniref:Porin n=1 Tax=Hymenobacter humi TaxID=1411620 RepID=A0ABW2U903_9BACT
MLVARLYSHRSAVGWGAARSYSPTLTQQEFVGNHYEWHHLPGTSSEFSNTNTTQLTGRLRLKLPSLGSLTGQHFEASVSAVNIANLVYYNTLGVPAQVTTARNIQIARARHQVRVGRLNFDNQATYTKGADVEGLRIPVGYQFAGVLRGLHFPQGIIKPGRRRDVLPVALPRI